MTERSLSGHESVIDDEHLPRMLDGPYHRKTVLRTLINAFRRAWQWLMEPTRG